MKRDYLWISIFMILFFGFWILVGTLTAVVDVDPDDSNDLYLKLFNQVEREEERVLPVDLSIFTSTVTTDDCVQLIWAAESERNMYGYNIYRSMDERIDNAVKVNRYLIGSYNSSVTINYSYLDRSVNTDKQYFYWLQINDLDMNSRFYGPISIHVSEEFCTDYDLPQIPLQTKLIGAYPDPIKPGTQVVFSLDKPAKVTVTVYNSTGGYVSTLSDGQEFPEGQKHTLYFDSKDSAGNDITSGVYLYIMQTDSNYCETNKLVLLK